MLTTLIVFSSSFVGRARASQPNGVEGYPIREGQARERIRVKDWIFSSDQPISGKTSSTPLAKVRPGKMSQQPSQDQNVKVYSDEASITNGSNVESTLQMANPQVVEEPEMGLVPQAQP